jgi:hypothetical protein
MAHYPYPTDIDLSSSNGLINLIIALNSATGGWLINMLLISIFTTFASGFYYARGDFWGGLSVGGFAVFLISVIFWVSGIVPTYVFLICTAVAIATFIGLFIHPD